MLRRNNPCYYSVKAFFTLIILVDKILIALSIKALTSTLLFYDFPVPRTSALAKRHLSHLKVFGLII
jgi:hypothetical protein